MTVGTSEEVSDTFWKLVGYAMQSYAILWTLAVMLVLGYILGKHHQQEKERQERDKD